MIITYIYICPLCMYQTDLDRCQIQCIHLKNSPLNWNSNRLRKEISQKYLLSFSSNNDIFCSFLIKTSFFLIIFQNSFHLERFLKLGRATLKLGRATLKRRRSYNRSKSPPIGFFPQGVYTRRHLFSVLF